MSYYARHIFFCCNQRDNDEACCMDHDSRRMRDYAKAKARAMGLTGPGKVRVNVAGCLDRCAEGPVAVVYPEGVWYTYVDEEDIDEILESHLRDGIPVDRLKI